MAYPDTLIRVRTDPSKIDRRYLAIVWNSEEIRQQIEATARTTAGIHKISQRDLEAFETPVFPLAVQKRIVDSHRKLSVLEEVVQKRVQTATLFTERLRRVILTKAFAGELVPNEAELARKEGRSYEPASLLLERTREPAIKDGVKKPRARRR